MFLSRSVTHGVFALCYLSRHDPGVSVSAGPIAEALNIPYEHARKIFSRLAAAGILHSTRGRSGGFSLAKPLAAVTMLEIWEALGPDPDELASPPRVCPITARAGCCVEPGLAAVRDRLQELLGSIALDSVLGHACRQTSDPEYVMLGV